MQYSGFDIADMTFRLSQFFSGILMVCWFLIFSGDSIDALMPRKFASNSRPHTSLRRFARDKQSKVENKKSQQAIERSLHEIDANEKELLIRELVNQLMNNLDDVSDEDRDEGPSHKRQILDQSNLLNGVIRIYCTHSQPNFGMPWQRIKQEFSTSSGFVIHGNKILTNAHAVEYGSLIQVKKRQCENKYVASVVAGKRF